MCVCIYIFTIVFKAEIASLCRHLKNLVTFYFTIIIHLLLACDSRPRTFSDKRKTTKLLEVAIPYVLSNFSKQNSGLFF